MVAGARRKAGLSQAWLSRKSGVSRRTIASWESRERADALVTHVQNVADALGVDRGEITGERSQTRIHEPRVYATMRDLLDRVRRIETKVNVIADHGGITGVIPRNRKHTTDDSEKSDQGTQTHNGP